MKTIAIILCLFAQWCIVSGCLDVVFSLDVSCSMTDADKEVMREIVMTVVNNFKTIGTGENDYQVAMLTYDRGVKKVFYLNEYTEKGALLDAIKNADLQPFDCRRLTYEALDRVRTEFFHRKTGGRANNTNFHLIMTDGVTAPTKRSDVTLKSADKLKKTGVESMVVAFSKTKNKKQVNESTEEWEAISTAGILRFNIMEEVTEEMGKTISDAMEENEKINCLEICGRPLDIVYIIDVSNSITIPNLRTVVSFLKNMTSKFNIGSMSYQTQVAAMSFNSEVFQHFKLNDFDNLDDVLTALDEIPLVNAKHTRTDLALQAAVDVFFTGGNGDRPNVPNVITLATDGRTYPVRFDKKTFKYATAAKEAGNKIFVLGVPNDRGRSGRDEWEEVASKPLSDYLFELERFSELNGILDPVAEEVCQRV